MNQVWNRITNYAENEKRNTLTMIICLALSLLLRDNGRSESSMEQNYILSIKRRKKHAYTCLALSLLLRDNCCFFVITVESYNFFFTYSNLLNCLALSLSILMWVWIRSSISFIFSAKMKSAGFELKSSFEGSIVKTGLANSSGEKRMNEWMNEWTNEWMNEWLKKGMNERMN